VCTSSREVVAERILRTMPGGTQSRLALCNDGIQYVIKCPNNPQGPNVLANEAIAARLMSAVGLPVPPSRVLRTMPGETPSLLVLCNDGIQYVIKCPNNPQGPNNLANEFIAARMMSAVGLPTPPSSAIRYNFDHKYVFELNHQDVFEEPACDLHFASELVMPTPGGTGK
jgi:hypothetical protein